jgi:S-layer protein
MSLAGRKPAKLKEINRKKRSVAALNATNKRESVSKLMKAWESKNAKRALQGAGLSTVAVSLAACGGSGTTTTTTTPVAPVVVAPAAQTFPLDVASNTVTGGAGNDTINGLTLDSWSASDAIDGGAGTDTMTVQVSGIVVPLNSSVNNVEILNIISTGAGFTIDTSSATNYIGLTTLGVQAGAGAIAVTTSSDATSVSTTGGTTVAVTDAGTTDVLASVSVLGAAGAVTVASDALTSLTLDTIGANNATVTAAAGTRAINITLDGLTTGGTITDATATTVTYTASGANSVVTALSNAAATTVNFAGDKTLTSAGETFTAATTITSTNSAGISLGTALGTGVTFTGGAGADTVTVGATTKAISMGAGNDTVTVGVSALGTGGTIDAGAGTDTIVMSAANAATATASLAASLNLAGKISGFQNASFTGFTTQTIDMALLDNISYISTAGTGATSTLANVASGATIVDVDGNTALTVLVKDAALSNTDSLNWVQSAAAGFDAGLLTADGVETLNITATDTVTAAITQHTLAVDADAIKSITVAGNAGIILTHTNTGTTLTSLDAAASTGAVTYTAAALASASTIVGSATATNVMTLSAATAAVNYTGGSGNDTVTIANALNNVLVLGNGTNVVNGVATGNNTITGGSGADTFITGTTGNNVINFGDGANAFTATTGNNIYTGGSGVDTVTVTSGNNTISTGGGVDVISVGGGANTVSAGAGNDAITISAIGTAASYTTITDINAGDTVNLAALTTVARVDGVLGNKIVLAGTATFTDYINQAASTVIADAGASLMKWFQYGGDTYLVVDSTTAGDTPDDNNVFKVGEDSIVAISGLVDLSLSTTASDILTIV